MNNASSYENLETAIAAASKKDPHDRTKLEIYVCDLAQDKHPRKLDKMSLLCSATFVEVAEKREQMVEAAKNGAPTRVLDAVKRQTDELFDNATTMVTVLALFGRKFWN